MTKRLILIVTILFTVITTAQENTSSPYSFYGIGLNAFNGTVENRSMGGLSIFSDSIHVNLTNPAGFGKLALTTYTVGASHSILNVTNGDEDESATVTTLDYLAIGIPADRFGFGFGLVPYSAVGYHLTTVDEEAGVASRYTGNGGLNRVFLSAGYAINDQFRVGVNFDYNFGTIENRNLQFREGVQFGSRELNRSELGGFSFKLGLEYERMISDRLEIRASTSYVPGANLNSRNSRQLSTILLNTAGQEVITDVRDFPLDDSEVSLPAQYGLGVGIGQPRKWFLGAEYTNSEAGNFNNRSFSRDGAEYTSSSKYRLGGFYIPDYSSNTSYFDRVVYRGGFRMEETGLILEGESIDEFGISFGVGLPAGGTFGNANVGLEYGQRGTTNAGVIKENFLNIMISLSLNDRWFQQRRFD